MGTSSDEEAPETGKFGKGEEDNLEANPFDPPVYGIQPSPFDPPVYGSSPFDPPVYGSSPFDPPCYMG